MNTSFWVQSCSFLPRWDWPTVRHRSCIRSHKPATGNPWDPENVLPCTVCFWCCFCLFACLVWFWVAVVLFYLFTFRAGMFLGLHMFRISPKVTTSEIFTSLKACGWLCVVLKERSHDKRILLGWGAGSRLSGGRRWAEPELNDEVSERWGSYPTR